jgi:hypothetical protein
VNEEGDLMAKTRREFTPEFKREAVALLESSGRPQMQIAAELGIQALDAEAVARDHPTWGSCTITTRSIAGSIPNKPSCLPIRPSGRDRPAPP